MAFTKSYSRPDGSAFPNAYWMIDCDKHDKLSMQISYCMVGWRDKAYRDSFSAVYSDYLAKQAAYVAASADRAAQVTEEATAPKRVIEDAAKMECEAALAAVSQRSPFLVLERKVEPARYASIVTDGSPDKGKIYAAEMALPEWSGAENV